MAETIIHRRVAAARIGKDPTVICRVRSGWAVVGDPQVVAGYSLLLPDPVVPDLNALSTPGRTQFLLDMVALGDAILEVTRATRINYEILGNLEPALHAHLFPRHDTEPAELRLRPVWFYDWSKAATFSASDVQEFMRAVADVLKAHDVAI